MVHAKLLKIVKIAEDQEAIMIIFIIKRQRAKAIQKIAKK